MLYAYSVFSNTPKLFSLDIYMTPTLSMTSQKFVQT